MLHWSLLWSVITLIVMVMVMIMIMSVLQNMWFRYLINFVLLSAVHVHSALIAWRYFAQTGSDFGPQPVGWVEGEGGGVQYGGVGDLHTEILKSDNTNSDSNSNNNLSNNINDIKQVDNQVNSNINSVNQISISILPVPG